MLHDHVSARESIFCFLTSEIEFDDGQAWQGSAPRRRDGVVRGGGPPIEARESVDERPRPSASPSAESAAVERSEDPHRLYI